MNHPSSKLKYLRFVWMRALTVGCVCWCMQGNVWAQSEAESASLSIETQQGSVEQVVRPGQRLDYRTQGGKMVRKGKVETVQDSSVTVAGKEIPFSQIEEVMTVKGHKHPRGSHLTRNSAIGIVVSALLFLLTVALWRGRSNSGQRGLMLFFALLAFLFFPVLLIIGLVMLLTGRHKYALGDKWKLKKSLTPEK